MKKIGCVLLIVMLLLPAESARAWSEGGHHLIALMAFRLLSKEEQGKLMAILEKHPRYVEDFSPPEGLSNDDEKRAWRIGRAGYWPDVARSQPTYHRPTWHYELGHALILGDAAKVNAPERPGALPAGATLESQELYLSQAFELCKKTLADKSKPEAERALALCWIAHLVADAHQPCHAGSLYMEGVFEEKDGDRGGNRIPLKQRGNVHALWDQLLGNRFSRSAQWRRMAEIQDDHELAAKGKEALTVAEGLHVQTWLAESRKYATEHVYRAEVIDSLNLVARGIVKEPQVVELSEGYLKSAGRVAQIRAIEAAHRLAETWREAIR